MSLKKEEYQQLRGIESIGTFTLGINIDVWTPPGVDIASGGMQRAAIQAVDLIQEQITREYYANNKEAQEDATRQRQNLISCFPNVLISLHPIPNGYCSRACCEHLPWYEVSTPKGVIKIGWRKSVIEIDWSDSQIKSTAKDLFSGEETTMFSQWIHAWGYDKAREYLRKILAEEVEG